MTLRRRGWAGRLGAALAASALLALSGCAEVGYLWQAGRGQAELLLAARPVQRVLADPATTPETRRKLGLALQARAFAVEELGLPDTRSLRTYADLGRPYAVWNVSSAPELSTELRTSCFPVAGCVGYRGYFREEDAERYAAARREAGDDVSVGGVRAYSTLGYLPDPLTSALLGSADSELVRVIFHELAHASLYVPDDTPYSESYAVAVERAGMRRFLARFGPPELRAEDERLQAREAEFQALTLQARRDLTALYAQALPDPERRQRKAARLARLAADLTALNARSPGEGAFRTNWNNASLGALAAYADLVPAFEARLQREGDDLRAFIRAAQACGKKEAAERTACLRGRFQGDASPGRTAPPAAPATDRAPCGRAARGRRPQYPCAAGPLRRGTRRG